MGPWAGCCVCTFFMELVGVCCMDDPCRGGVYIYTCALQEAKEEFEAELQQQEAAEQEKQVETKQLQRIQLLLLFKVGCACIKKLALQLEVKELNWNSCSCFSGFVYQLDGSMYSIP